MKERNKNLSTSISLKYFHFYCFMKSLYRFINCYTQWTEHNFMGRASIHFTGSVHANGSHHLPCVNSSFQRGFLQGSSSGKLSAWTTAVRGQKGAKQCGSRRTGPNPTPRFGLFSSHHPSEASLHWRHAAKPCLYHTCPTRQGLVEI